VKYTPLRLTARQICSILYLVSNFYAFPRNQKIIFVEYKEILVAPRGRDADRLAIWYVYACN